MCRVLHQSPLRAKVRLRIGNSAHFALSRDFMNKKGHLGVALMVGGLFGLLGMAKGFSGRTIDTHVFVRAAERFVEGQPLHRPEDLHMLFKYAPPVALGFWPLAPLGPQGASMFFGLLNGLLLAHVLWLWARRLGIASLWQWMLPVLALAHPLYLEAHFGQVDVLMMWLLTLSIGDEQVAPTWKAVLRGAGLAMAALIKPPAALVGLFTFGRRLVEPHRRKEALLLCAGAVGVGLLGVAIVALVYAPRPWAPWTAWRDVLASTTPPWIMGKNSQGLLPLVWSLGESKAPASMADVQPYLLGLTLAFGACASWVRTEGNRLLPLALLGACVLSPLAWRANYVLALPLLLSLVADASPIRRRAGAMLCLVGMALSVLFVDAVIAFDREHRVLMMRPWALWAIALMIAAVWPVRSRSSNVTLR